MSTNIVKEAIAAPQRFGVNGQAVWSTEKMRPGD